MLIRSSHQKGFTIVELLIVIVVIAILAAITVVAYNGIQTRAYNANVISGVQAYLKAFHEYKAVNSSYPGFNGCLGANYPGDQCWQGVSGTAAVSAMLDVALAEFVPQKPTLATARMSIGNADNMRAGLFYRADSAKFIYYLKGPGQSCAIPGAFAYTEGGVVTQCQIMLP